MILLQDNAKIILSDKKPELSGRVFLFSPLLILFPAAFYIYIHLTGQILS